MIPLQLPHCVRSPLLASLTISPLLHSSVVFSLSNIELNRSYNTIMDVLICAFSISTVIESVFTTLPGFMFLISDVLDSFVIVLDLFVLSWKRLIYYFNKMLFYLSRTSSSFFSRLPSLLFIVSTVLGLSLQNFLVAS